MEDMSTARELERELTRLRARAYGPNPDIQDDPPALARLAELEGRAHGGPPAASSDPGAQEEDVPGVGTGDDAPDPSLPGVESATSTPRDPSGVSGRSRLSSTGAGRMWLAAGAGVALVAAMYGTTWLFGSHPDATLHPSAREVEGELFAFLPLNRRFAEELRIRTLKSYETFRGIEPWFAEDYFGSPCLVLVERSTGAVVEMACTPGGVDLVADLEAWPVLDPDFAEGLPDGSIIRFQLRGDAVDAYVYRAPTGE